MTVNEWQDRIAELETRVSDRDAISRRLLEAEQRAASLPTLKLEIRELQGIGICLPADSTATTQ